MRVTASASLPFAPRPIPAATTLLFLALVLLVAGCGRCGSASEASAAASSQGAAPSPVAPAPPNAPRKIDHEKGARRLARAVYSDLALYSLPKVSGLPPERVREALGPDLAEGRTLFAERVAPEHHHIFDEEFGYYLRVVGARLRIETTESARFLARSLVQAIRADPAFSIDHAREFFQARVPPDLRGVFDEVLVEPADGGA